MDELKISIVAMIVLCLGMLTVLVSKELDNKKDITIAKIAAEREICLSVEEAKRLRELLNLIESRDQE